MEILHGRRRAHFVYSAPMPSDLTLFGLLGIVVCSGVVREPTRFFQQQPDHVLTAVAKLVPHFHRQPCWSNNPRGADEIPQRCRKSVIAIPISMA